MTEIVKTKKKYENGNSNMIVMIIMNNINNRC